MIFLVAQKTTSGQSCLFLKVSRSNTARQRQTDRQRDRQTDRQADRQTDTHTHTHTQYNSLQRMISSSQRPLPTQHKTHTRNEHE